MKKTIIFVWMLVLVFMSIPFQAHAQSAYYSTLTIKITSDPQPDSSGVVVGKVGDTITFTSVSSMTISMGTGHWLYNPIVLSCDNGDDATKLVCKAKATGDATVTYSIDVMTDWNAGKATYQTFTAPSVKARITDASGSPTCELPLVPYQGGCVAETSPCQNPPANSTQCVDLVKDGKLEEHHAFLCNQGFTKQGDECVAGNGGSSAPAMNPAKPVAQPDLTISVAKALTVTRRINGAAKRQYKIGVTVKNAGKGDAVGDVNFSYNSSAPILTAKGGLKAHTSRKVFIYVDTTEKGKPYTFTADPANTIDESNEDNNTATRVIGK
jgi:CARDB